jgi:hypothetical protein
MRSSVFLLVACTGLLTAVASCNKTNNVSTSNETNNVFSKEIDEDGGTVGDKRGLSVYIPGGAVGEPVTITIREAEEGEYPPLAGSVAGKVYAIEPHGLELAAKATVHLPFPAGYDPGFLQAIHAPLDGAWEPINGGLEQGASTATFGTYTFSFFALRDVQGPGIPDGKPIEAPGASGSSYGGGASSSAGATGSGGSAPTAGSAPVGGNEYCPADDMAPIGSSDITGPLKLSGGASNFAAVDGLAAKLVMGEHTRLMLTFTETPQACGAVLAAGTPLGPKPIAGGRPGVSVALTVEVYTPGTPGVIPAETTYPRGGQPEMIDVMAYQLNATCNEMMSPLAPTATVTIDTISADRVSGSFMLPDDGSGSSLSGTFDVPFCALPDSPETRCCVEP